MANSVAYCFYVAIAALLVGALADEAHSFSFGSFGKDPNFKSSVALFGAARVISGGSAIRLNSSGSGSAQVLLKKPFSVVGGKEQRLASFSSYFSFSMSGGSILGFVMLPGSLKVTKFDGSDIEKEMKNQSNAVSVDFDSRTNHVAIEVGGVLSAKSSNFTSENLILNSGEKLQSWVDYEASSKRLEVRLNKASSTRPIDPLMSFTTDLPHLWKEEQVFVSLTASDGTSYVYSWSFKLRQYPHWLHSEPVDPNRGSRTAEPVVLKQDSGCTAKTVVALLAGLAGGALGAIIVLYIWSVSGGRRSIPVVPEEYAAKAKGFEFEKVEERVEEYGKK